MSDIAQTQDRTLPEILEDPGRRYPLILSPDYYDRLSYLTEEEKAVGREMMRVKMANIPGVEQPPEHAAIQIRNPCMMFQFDPPLFEREMDDYDVMAKLVMGLTTDEIMGATDENGLQVQDPDIRRRYNTAQLMVAKVAHEYQDEWTLRLMSTTPAWTLSKQQYCLLDQPGSVVWNDEERLILEFTGGVVNRSMSDDLFARAEDLWGKKQLLRYAKWITYYIGLILFDHINVTDAEKNGQL